VNNWEALASHPLEESDGRPRLAGGLPTLHLACAYDTLRLSIYQRRGRRGQTISIDRLGSSTLLRFDDVGYFNTVYSEGADVENQLEAFEAHFDTSRHGCRLQSSAIDDRGALAGRCRERHWVPETQYAWLSGPSQPNATHPSAWTIRIPRRDQTELFFRTYLEAFEAEPERFPAAIDNMRHLFDERTLHFLLAFHEKRAVGVGLLFQYGQQALLCGGAMIPSHRRLGGHEALLSARRALAWDLGCTEIHSWAIAGGQSHLNMARAGLDTVAVTPAWRWHSRRRA
jgi:hypothetical protein